MVKRSRGKKQEEETEKQKHFIVTENNLFKCFTTKFTIRSSLASLIMASHGIPPIVEDSWTLDQERHLPSLSNLPDFIGHNFEHFDSQRLNKSAYKLIILYYNAYTFPVKKADFY